MSLDKAQALDAAKQYVLQRNVQAAVDIYQKLIQDDPADVIASITLGELYASTGHVREAIAQFTRVADHYIKLGYARQAIATLKQIIAIDPGNTETAIKLADLYAQAGLPSEARQHYLQIAEALNRKGEIVEALSVFSRIVQLDPSNTSNRIKLGELYLREGMNEQAYDAFMTAAGQLAAAGEHRRALNAYNEALAIRPDSRDASAAARKLMSLLGIPPDKVLRSAANQTDDTNGAVQENPAQPAPASYDSSSASTEPGSDSFVVQEVSKAEILVAYGKVKEAISMLRQVLDSRPDNIDLHIKLKDIYLRNGMMVEAAHECIALERIFETRGETERARDYAVRASRLTHLIEQPSGDLSEPARKKVDEANRRLNTAPLGSTPRRDTTPKPIKPEPRPAERTSVAPSSSGMDDAPTKPVNLPPSSPPMSVPVVSSNPNPAPPKPAANVQPAPPPKPAANVQPASPPKPAANVQPAPPPKPAANAQPAPPPQPAASVHTAPPPKPAANVQQAPPPKPAANVQQAPPPQRPQGVPASPQQSVNAPAKQSVDVLQAPPTMRISVAPPSSPQAMPPKPTLDQPPALKLEPVENLQAAQTKLSTPPAEEWALVPATQPLVDAREPNLPALFASQFADVRKRGRLSATGIAAGVLLLLGAGAVIGGFAYNSYLDKEYASVSLTTPPVTLPPPPAPAEENAVEVAAQNEAIEVDVTPGPDTSDQKSVREREVTPDKAAKRDQPAPAPPITAPTRSVTQPMPLPPRAIASPDVRAGSDPRAPAGVPGEVPIGPTQAAEPPPKLPRQSPGVVVGTAIYRVDPVYPMQAKEARQSGPVAVEVTISEQGNVVSARALTGPLLLRNAAVAAARGWRFKASTLGGVPVQTTTTIVFNFRL